MVDSGQPGIPSVSFTGRSHADLPVEVMKRSELVGRIDPGELAAPQRPSFFVVLVGSDGEGTHGVDFETVSVGPGRMVQIRPGQVQLWDATSRFEATVVVARAAVAPAASWFPGDAAERTLDPASLATAESLLSALLREQERFDGAATSVRLMTALFLALLALFERPCRTGPEHDVPAAYLAFRGAVEADLAKSRNVRDYVADLGWSERTVDRACRESTGRSAKALLDARCVLEAKRLLAHTSLPAAGVGQMLGFREATNFHKFFARHAGQRPSEFRAELRASGYLLDVPAPAGLYG